jgi:hypothetical protein
MPRKKRQVEASRKTKSKRLPPSAMAASRTGVLRQSHPYQSALHIMRGDVPYRGQAKGSSVGDYQGQDCRCTAIEAPKNEGEQAMVPSENAHEIQARQMEKEEMLSPLVEALRKNINTEALEKVPEAVAEEVVFTECSWCSEGRHEHCLKSHLGTIHAVNTAFRCSCLECGTEHHMREAYEGGIEEGRRRQSAVTSGALSKFCLYNAANPIPPQKINELLRIVGLDLIMIEQRMEHIGFSSRGPQLSSNLIIRAVYQIDPTTRKEADKNEIIEYIERHVSPPIYGPGPIQELVKAQLFRGGRHG